MGRRIVLCSVPVVLAMMVLSCSKESSMESGGPVMQAQLLSTGSPTKDEDPSVLRAADGRLFVAWFSDRGGNADIYIVNSDDGIAWSTPSRVTTDAGGDFNPCLYQGSDSVFHLVWFRWQALYRGHIMYNQSQDGIHWDPAHELQVTTDPDVDDWVPTLTALADGTLLTCFVSSDRDAAHHKSDIYAVLKHPGQPAWGAPRYIDSVNSPALHDHLPVVAHTNGAVSMVWVRYDDTVRAVPWQATKVDLYTSSSSDGMLWGPPVRITNEPGNVLHLFPSLYQRHDLTWELVWLSAAGGATTLYEIPLQNAGVYPQGRITNTSLGAGYSHKITRTHTVGQYLGVWVQGPEGSQDIYYQLFNQ